MITVETHHWKLCFVFPVPSMYVFPFVTSSFRLCPRQEEYVRLLRYRSNVYWRWNPKQILHTSKTPDGCLPLLINRMFLESCTCTKKKCLVLLPSNRHCMDKENVEWWLKQLMLQARECVCMPTQAQILQDAPQNSEGRVLLPELLVFPRGPLSLTNLPATQDFLFHYIKPKRVTKLNHLAL